MAVDVRFVIRGVITSLALALVGLAAGHALAVQQAIDHDAAAEFNRRALEVQRLQVHEQMALVEWAVERGLIDEAETLCRTIVKANPEHEDAYARLCELAASRVLPSTSSARQAARDALDSRFLEFQSKRWVVITDCGAVTANRQLALLEQTHHQYMRFCNRLKLRPLPLSHKLVCLLFANAVEYRAFAFAQDGVKDPNISGYYSPHHDWIVFFHADSSAAVKEAHEQIAAMQTEANELSQRASHAALRGNHEEAQHIRTVARRSHQHIDQQRRRVDEFSEHQNIATTIHEATHHLLFHTGVQSRQVRYPLWICEGLATCFETDVPEHAFGPDIEYGPRRQRFEELLASNALLPLRELIALENLSDQHTAALYQQGYALVTWLYRHRRSQMRDYLQLMTQPKHGDSMGHVATFESCFGNLEALERTWLHYERASLKRMMRSQR